MTVSIPHQLSRAEARKRVEEMIAQLQRQYSSMVSLVEEKWVGDTLHFSMAAMGMTVSGQVFVEDQAVRLEMALPWALSMLAGSMRQSIEQEGRKLLSQR
jgi:putative polyhydroxyalkanoate system protein